MFEDNQDRGEGVRLKVKEILELLEDDQKIEQEREKAK